MSSEAYSRDNHRVRSLETVIWLSHGIPWLYFWLSVAFRVSRLFLRWWIWNMPDRELEPQRGRVNNLFGLSLVQCELIPVPLGSNVRLFQRQLEQFCQPLNPD